MQYFDLHCDTITECFKKKCGLHKNKLHISVPDAKNLDAWVQFFAVWIQDNMRGQQAWQYFLDVCDVFKKETQENDLAVCGSTADLEAAMSTKEKRAAILSIEGSAALGGNIDNLKTAYEKGVRMITLTWNGVCEAGGGCADGAGLTPYGFELINHMQKFGIVIDVSHLSDRGFKDVVSKTDAPFVASHSNSRAVCDNPRNLTDEQFREIVARGGIVGLNFFPQFLGSKSVNSMLWHIDRFLKLGGEKAIAIGSDFDGAAMPREIGGIKDIPILFDIIQKEFGETLANCIFFNNAYDFFKSALTQCKSCNNINI